MRITGVSSNVCKWFYEKIIINGKEDKKYYCEYCVAHDCIDQDKLYYINSDKFSNRDIKAYICYCSKEHPGVNSSDLRCNKDKCKPCLAPASMGICTSCRGRTYYSIWKLCMDCAYMQHKCYSCGDNR